MAINLKDTVQIIRGKKADITARTGANGELNWADDTYELYIHDGKTRGGHLIGKASGTASVIGGAGIAVSTSDGISTVSIKRDPANVLYATTDGAGVRIGTSGALQITAQNALDLRVAEGGGIIVDSNGIKVDSAVLSSVFRYAGQVNSVDDLPSDAQPGDVYDVKDSGANYVWSGTSWDNLGGIMSVDSAPTQGSTNPVASGGVYDAIQAQKLSGDGITVTTADNVIMAQDIAIGGDTSDLASARGQIGDIPLKSETTDLNSLVVTGCYSCLTAQGITYHHPMTVTNSSAIVTVQRRGAVIFQTWTEIGQGNTFTRFSGDSGAFWGPWQAVGGQATSNLVIWVSKSGSDTNTGLSSSYPVLTINRALRIAQNVFTQNSSTTVTFRLGEGDWGTLVLNALPFGLYITDYSDASTSEYSTSYPKFSTINIRQSFVISRNIVVDTLYVDYGGVFLAEKYIRYGFIQAVRNGVFTFNTTKSEIKSVSSAAAALIADQHGIIISVGNIQHNIVENITVGYGLLYGSAMGIIYISNPQPFIAESGVVVTGKKYHINTNASIVAKSKAALDSLPGTQAGVLAVNCIFNGAPWGGGVSDSFLAADGNWRKALLQSGGTTTAPICMTASSSLYHGTLEKGTIPSSDTYIGFFSIDNAKIIDQDHRFGMLETAIRSNGDVETYISAYANIAGSSNHKNLTVRAKTDGSGEVLFDGRHIVRSVGGAAADANGNVNAPYLPLAGGNVTGPINLYVGSDYYGAVRAISDTNGKRLLLDGYEQGDMGAYIALYKSSSNINSGYFVLASRDNTSESHLIGIPTGVLSWKGKNIVRSVNNINADSNGNVSLNLAGIKVNNAVYADSAGSANSAAVLSSILSYNNVKPRDTYTPNYGIWIVFARPHTSEDPDYTSTRFNVPANYQLSGLYGYNAGEWDIVMIRQS